MNRYTTILLLAAILLLSGCMASEKILYLQDIEVNTSKPIGDWFADITVEPRDMISITVSSGDIELATQFNLPLIAYTPGGAQGVNVGNRVLGYTVDYKGDIDFPVLGTIHIAGLTRTQISTWIKAWLIASEMINDPVVTVEFMNLHISVMGEVKSPGRYAVNQDQLTLLEALTMAGDLTIQGKRDGVFVVREDNGVRTTYAVDLRSAELFRSPAYYLKQNDVIYVQPNRYRSGQSTANENSFISVSFWISIASALMSLGLLIKNW